MSGDQDCNIRQILKDNLCLINDVLVWVKRRHRLSEDEVEEIRSMTYLRLVENDYRVLRKCRESSRLRAYLTTVVLRLVLDERSNRWGRWRPSRVARSIGTVAVRLEELTSRDKFSLSEATRILTSEGYPASEHSLEKIARRLRPKNPKVRKSLHSARRKSSGTRTDHRILRKRQHRQMEGIRRRMLASLERLPVEDQEILRLRFEEGLKVSQIATKLGIRQRRLYYRIDRCLRRLRQCLIEAGISRNAIVAHPDPWSLSESDSKIFGITTEHPTSASPRNSTRPEKG